MRYEVHGGEDGGIVVLGFDAGEDGGVVVLGSEAGTNQRFGKTLSPSTVPETTLYIQITVKTSNLTPKSLHFVHKPEDHN